MTRLPKQHGDLVKVATAFNEIDAALIVMQSLNDERSSGINKDALIRLMDKIRKATDTGTAALTTARAKLDDVLGRY